MGIASQLSFSTATSVRGGALGSIPYQSATSSTVFVSIGAAGTVLTSSGTAPIWAAASSIAAGTATYIASSDDRVKAPSDDSASAMRFGFTSLANNNTSPYADYLHLRSYADGTGGNDNLVMFRKDAIGMRIYQQAWGSATAYSTFKDVAFTDSSISGAAGQVNTVLRTTSDNHFLTFVDSNNAVSTAEAVYTTSTFTINPATGFVGVGSQDGASPLNVRALSTLSGTINSFQRILTTQASGGLGNNVYRTEWRRRRAAGTDWSTQNIHDGIWVDSSFTTPMTDTRTWWDRDPNTTSQAWGDQATTWMFHNSSALFLTGGSSQLNTGFTNRLNVTGSIVAGSASSTSGSIILQGQYGTGSITNLGTEYSSGGPVLGYGVYPSNTATGAFFSSSGLALTRGAYTIAGNVHNWYVGASQTLAIGSTATLSLAMSVSSSGINLPTAASGNANISFDGTTFTLVSNSSSAGLVLSTNSTERLRITSTGGVSFGATGTAYGTSGQILQSNGNASPTWVAVSGLTAGTATQVQTVLRTTNASHFLTFVDSNNASATAETVYTTSSFTINPQSGNISVGGSITASTVGSTFALGIAAPSQTGSASIAHIAGGSLKIDANRSFAWDGTFPTAITGVSGAAGSITINAGNSGVPVQFLAQGVVNIQSTTAATSTITGALRVVGGVGIGGDVIIGRSLAIGTTSSGVIGEIRAANEITAYFSSDIRLKENIRLIADPITIVNQIRGVYYDWTDEHIKARGGEDGYFVRKHDIGVIAQEVEKVLPEIVAERDDGTKVVKYEKLVALLIEAVKDQQRQINQISQALKNLAIK